jgi:nicotinate-nucleotide--dimethylbenzimidazole phosphoribosyltransferase
MKEVSTAAVDIDRNPVYHCNLGKFEDLQKLLPERDPGDKLAYCLIVFAGDNGISAEHASSYRPFQSGEIVTKHLDGTAVTSMMMNRLDRKELVVDVGLYEEISHPGLWKNYKVARGTRNIRFEDAMERFQVDRAIQAGEKAAMTAWTQGHKVLGIGEIGIANTLGAYAMVAHLFHVQPALVAGFGSDRSGHHYSRRIRLVEELVERLRNSPIESMILLQKVGSLELAAMVGAVLTASRLGVPMVLDGFMAATAALIAGRINGNCRRFLVVPCQTQEPAQKIALHELQLAPLLDLNLNYGEGLGAAIGLFFLELADMFRNRQDFIETWEN